MSRPVDPRSPLLAHSAAEGAITEQFHRRPKNPAEQWASEAPSVGSPKKRLPSWDAAPSRALHVRFNDRELHELKSLAEEADASQQKVLRKIVRSYLRASKRARLALIQDQAGTGPDLGPNLDQ